jgi:hypothetical protein
LGFVVILFAFFIDSHNVGQIQTAMATSTVSTSVTVLNTPPLWTTNAQEVTESSAANPTNSGDTVSWTAQGTDSSGDAYYLLICNTNAAATARSGLRPVCSGGDDNMWAVSASTVSAVFATAATTTAESWSPSNIWYAFICDGNAILPKCNLNGGGDQQGTGLTASPFIVNHRPTFTVYSDDSPKNPGTLVTWTSTSADAEGAEPDDTVNLFVCKTNSFATSTGTCNGGQWCTSGLTATNPTCGFTLEDPKPDRNYGAYGFIIDNHNHGALYTGGNLQGTDSVLTVNNVTPTITPASISLNDTDLAGPLVLTQAQGQTTGFSVKFTVSDQNSCIANGSTTPEIIHTSANVFRSDKDGIASSSAQYDPNFAYTHAYNEAYGATGWNLVCSQDANTCMGEGDSSVTWTCTFPLWYVASPTDTNTPWTANTWLASVTASDKLYATSTEVEGSTPNEVQSAMYFNVATTSIAYGGLEPGQWNTTLSIPTDLSTIGNTGLNERLYGDDMCVTYPACTGYATSTIPVTEQKYTVTQDALYAAGTSLQLDDGLGALLALHVPKTTATATPQARNTYWGINIPAAITFSGNYIGQNSLIGTVSAPADW